MLPERAPYLQELTEMGRETPWTVDSPPQLLSNQIGKLGSSNPGAVDHYLYAFLPFKTFLPSFKRRVKDKSRKKTITL